RSRAPPASRLQQTPAHPRNGESVRGLGCAARGIQPRLRAAARKGRSPQITGGQRRRPGVRRSHSPLAVAARPHSGPRRSNASHWTHSAIEAPCHPERSRGTSPPFLSFSCLFLPPSLSALAVASAPCHPERSARDLSRLFFLFPAFSFLLRCQHLQWLQHLVIPSGVEGPLLLSPLFTNSTLRSNPPTSHFSTQLASPSSRAASS